MSSHPPATKVTNINQAVTWARVRLRTRNPEVNKIDTVSHPREVTVFRNIDFKGVATGQRFGLGVASATPFLGLLFLPISQTGKRHSLGDGW